MLVNNLETKIKEIEKNYISIPAERRKLLKSFAIYILEKLKEEEEINLIFICTHNSRRSTMSQIWAQTAAEYYGIPNIKCYSGGTEATAFNPRTVKAVRDFGFKVEKKNEGENPTYLVSYSNEKEPIKCFSKVYSDPFNPQKDFAAIMTCSDADANCPVVFGAETRFPIRYEDPKEFDGTDLEELKYNERLNQIATEIVYVFKNVKNL